MPFANDGSFVTCFLQQFGKGQLASIKGAAIVDLPIQMVMLTREHHGPARSTYSIADKTIGKQSTFVGQPVQMRRPDQMI